jgi:hypothetical protein
MEQPADRPPAGSSVPGLLVEPGAENVEQQHVEQRGHDGVRPEAGVVEFAAEQVHGGAQLGAMPETGWQMHDIGQIAEQRMCAAGVELVPAAHRNGDRLRAVRPGVADDVGGVALVPSGIVLRVADRFGQRGGRAVCQRVPASVREEHHVAGGQRRRGARDGYQPAGSLEDHLEGGRSRDRDKALSPRGVPFHTR